MKISAELLLNWIQNSAVRESANLHVPPLGADALRNCPSAWRPVLGQKIDKSSFISQTWGAQQFPETTVMLQQKLQELALLQRGKDGPQELLYIFQDHGALRLFAGGEPTEEVPSGAEHLDIDLRPLYRIHNGFLDMADGMAGFAAVEDVQILDEDSSENRPSGFLKIFEIGSNCLGFNLSDINAGAYIIWGSDEDVEEVDNFWDEIDEWIASQLEGYDDANN